MGQTRGWVRCAFFFACVFLLVFLTNHTCIIHASYITSSVFLGSSIVSPSFCVCAMPKSKRRSHHKCPRAQGPNRSSVDILVRSLRIIEHYCDGKRGRHLPFPSWWDPLSQDSLDAPTLYLDGSLPTPPSTPEGAGNLSRRRSRTPPKRSPTRSELLFCSCFSAGQVVSSKSSLNLPRSTRIGAGPCM